MYGVENLSIKFSFLSSFPTGKKEGLYKWVSTFKSMEDMYVQSKLRCLEDLKSLV